MRILLVGEYSGFHNALKAGLVALGHEVTLVGDGDGFKGYPVDIHVGSDWYSRNPVRAKFKVGFQKITGRNLEDRLRLARFRESAHLMTCFDMVQFVNSNPFGCEPEVEKSMLEHLIENNGKCVLAGVGDDTYYIDYLKNHHQGYSILDPVKGDALLKPYYYHSFKYLREDYRANFDWLMGHCVGLLPYIADFDMAATGMKKKLNPLPLPVQVGKLKISSEQEITQPDIFLGINSRNYYKKGIHHFEEALAQLENLQKNTYHLTRAENLPYTEYMRQQSEAHILLDQCLTYGQGYNALEAMAQGKVVFAGNQNPALPDSIAIPVVDARPDASSLFQELEFLITRPSKIKDLGEAAAKHVRAYHDCREVAQQFLKWLND